MTPIWNDEIERIKQDADASAFLVSFASQAEAKSTLHKLSFARQITKDGKTGLALPGHIIFKVGKSDEGTLWVLLAGRLSINESLEAYEVFGMHGNEQMIVLPSQVESRITGKAATPCAITPAPEPAKVTPTQTPPEIEPRPVFVKVAPVQEPAKVVSAPEHATFTPTPVVAARQPQKEDHHTSPPTPPASNDQNTTRIYLARQGKREGPFTLDHINAQIAARRFKDEDFWAWHDGLPEWIPLYKIPGVGHAAGAKSGTA